MARVMSDEQEHVTPTQARRLSGRWLGKNSA